MGQTQQLGTEGVPADVLSVVWALALGVKSKEPSPNHQNGIGTDSVLHDSLAELEIDSDGINRWTEGGYTNSHP